MASDIKTLFPEDLPTATLQAYLQSAVAPRPIALVSTQDAEGRVNLSPFSYFNVFSANPPILLFSPVRRIRDNQAKQTLENLYEVPECTIQMVHFDLVEQTSLSSTEYPKGVNEFSKAGLTEVPSVRVKPPRVGEANISFECKVREIISLGEHAGAGQLVMVEIVALHIHSEVTHPDGSLDTTKLDLVARMGENWYTKTRIDQLFEIPKPLSQLGMGFDQLPEPIRTSPILTGNQLARIANTRQPPTHDEIQAAMSTLEPMHTALSIHQKAAALIDQHELDKAKALLWASLQM